MNAILKQFGADPADILSGCCGILKQFKAAVNDPDERALDNVMSFYG